MEPALITAPAVVEAAGYPPKQIEEFIGRINSGTEAVSIARMRSPAGWSEPGQTPDFDEYTLVLRGTVSVETGGARHEVKSGQAFVAPRGRWVRYSTPAEGGAEYVSVCLPAFSPQAAHRASD